MMRSQRRLHEDILHLCHELVVVTIPMSINFGIRRGVFFRSGAQMIGNATHLQMVISNNTGAMVGRYQSFSTSMKVTNNPTGRRRSWTDVRYCQWGGGRTEDGDLYHKLLNLSHSSPLINSTGSGDNPTPSDLLSRIQTIAPDVHRWIAASTPNGAYKQV